MTHEQLRRQIRAGRELLGLNQAAIAELMDVSLSKISRAENGDTKSVDTLLEMKSVLDRLGIEIGDDGGVHPKQTRLDRLSGHDGFIAFMDDVYATAKTVGGEICLFNGVPAQMQKWLGAEWYAMHARRMGEIKDKFTFKVTVCEGEKLFIGGGFAEYRWFPKKLFNEHTIYVYGSKLAFLEFDEKDVRILVLHQKETADSFRTLFNLAWEHVAKPIPNQGARAG
jgi:transcriptional regulator with XRE-family HTH domain